VNGLYLGSGGKMSAPPARNEFNALYFTIANGTLKPGLNEIDIRVVSDSACKGALGPFYLGPDELLRPDYSRGFFVRVTLVHFIFASMLISLFYIGMLALNTREPVYFYFSGMLAASALFHSAVIVTESPFPGWFWDWIRMMGTGWLVVFVTLFIHRFFELPRKKLERLMLLWAVSGSLVVLISPIDWQHLIGTYFWDVLAILLGVYALITSLLVSLRTRRAEHFAIVFSLLVLLGAGVRDWFVFSINPTAYRGTLLIYAVVYPLLVFAWILLQRFTTALSEADALNHELEERVQCREAELEKNYEKVAQAQKQQALIEERERITRDMHDGIGGQLVSATAAAKKGVNEELVDSLEVALADLRLMIDSFEPVYNDLTTVLGLVRMRLEKRLQHHGLAFNWQVGDVAEVPDLSPHKVLQVMRIIEEAVTNVIRHADATQITVSAHDEMRQGNSGVGITVVDNGKGMGDHPSHGRGLNNMLGRANSIGGELSIEGSASGTSVHLWLPAPGFE